MFKVSAGGLRSYVAPAIGAMIGSAIVLTAGNLKRQGAVAVIATGGFAVGLGFLGLSTLFWVGLIAVGTPGFSDAIGVAIRRTMVEYLAPDQMRGRASSFLTVFAQTTNALGAVIAGAAAALIGAPDALLLGSVLCAVLSRGLLGNPAVVGLSFRKAVSSLNFESRGKI